MEEVLEAEEDAVALLTEADEEAITRARWTMALLEEEVGEDVQAALNVETASLVPTYQTSLMTTRQVQKTVNNFTVSHFHDLHADLNIEVPSDGHNLILPDFEYIPFDDKVGGRVSLAWRNWEMITSNAWVLDVVKNGYKLEFNEYPPLTSTPIFEELNLPPIQDKAVHEQVEELLQQGAIQLVNNPYTPRFYSKLFVRQKKSDNPEPEFRLIIDLSRLNEYLIVPHFTMESNKTVRQELRPGVYFCKFDLRHAYLHILIHPSSRKYLSFVHRGKVFEWVSLPFGLASSPFVFTKVIAEVGKFVHLRGLKLIQFLDDWLLICLIIRLICLQRDYLLQILFALGWIINEVKSILDPLQTTDYLGAHYNSLTAMVYNTQERWQKILHTVTSFMQQNSPPARLWCQVLGLLTSAQEFTQTGRIALRPLQFHLNTHWKGHRYNLFYPIPLNQTCIQALSWWLNPHNVTQGVLWSPPPPTLHITTDSSLHAYGGHMGSLTFQGTWGPEYSHKHINWKELKTIHLALLHWMDHIQNQSLMIHSDNTSALAFLRHQGGTHSWELYLLARDIWTLITQANAHLQVQHIAGKHNTWADLLSRPKLLQATEWSLLPSVTQAVFRIWGTPHIDLFASKWNKKLECYCSLMPDNQAYVIDSLSFPWDNLVGYAYPPPRMIGQVLNHIEKHSCQIIFICPLWPRAPWYPRLLDLLVDFPLSLPPLPHLLKQPRTHQVYHSHPERLGLHAWKLSSCNSMRKVFLRKLSLASSIDTDIPLASSMSLNGKNTFVGAIRGKHIHSTPLRL